MGLASKEGSKDFAGKRMKVVIRMGRMVQGKEGMSDSKALGWSGAPAEPGGGGKYGRTEGSEPSCQR